MCGGGVVAPARGARSRVNRGVAPAFVRSHGFDWQAHRKRRAFVRAGAAHVDGSTVQFHQALHDGKPQPQPAELSAITAVRPGRSSTGSTRTLTPLLNAEGVGDATAMSRPSKGPASTSPAVSVTTY